MSLALLIVFMGMLAVWVWRDFKDYPRFKAMTETRDRQRTFARWIGSSFALFTLGSLAALRLINALPALMTPPPQFAPVLRWAAPLREKISADFLGGMAVSAVLAIVVIGAVSARSSSKAPPMVGDIQALMPRNRAEYGWAALLSVNAGVSEEMFFRLTLPLLLTNVIGDAALGFMVAAVIFGLAHLYQGVAGVVVTAIVGGVMSALYLATGSLMWPILLHAVIDLRGLVLQPALGDFFRNRSSSPQGH